MRYDIAVIGTGPAGLSAAINAKNRNRNIIIFGKKNLSDKIISAHEINNYLGLYGMTGMEVAEAFKNHIDRMGFVFFVVFFFFVFFGCFVNFCFIKNIFLM